METSSISSEAGSSIDLTKVPRHVAIIMDGNRRWAKKKKKASFFGHLEGAEVIKPILKAASKIGVKVLTVFAFSTENWGRSFAEIDYLMHLLKRYLDSQRGFLVKEGVKLGVIGDLTKMSSDLIESLDKTIEATRTNDKIELVLALNYGGRDEIRRAMVTIADDCMQGKITKNEITEELISRYLDTASWDDPDLLIRTSGEQRVSNFLLWQISYTEIYITNVLWPEFSEKEFFDAIVEFQRRERRLGGCVNHELNRAL